MRSRSRRVFSHIDQVSNTLVNPYCVSMSEAVDSSSAAGSVAASAPLPLEEVDVAVPEAGRDRQRGQSMTRPPWGIARTPGAHGNDLAV